MSKRSGSRIAIALAAGALAFGISQVPASAGESGAADWYVSGVSDSGCSASNGEYTYSAVPETNPTQYNAEYSLSVWRESCGSSVTAHLRVRYSEWDGWDWYDSGWKTIASSAGSGYHYDEMFSVKDVRFAVCDYTSARGNFNCGYVS
jgi:hypothetical protein